MPKAIKMVVLDVLILVLHNSVGLNPVCGFIRSSGFLEGSGGFVVQFWSVNLGQEGFGGWFFQIWAQVQPISGQTGEKFGLFGWVRSLVLVDEPMFERVQSLTYQVQSSLKFVIFGFNPTLLLTIKISFHVFHVISVDIGNLQLTQVT